MNTTEKKNRASSPEGSLLPLCVEGGMATRWGPLSSTMEQGRLGGGGAAITKKKRDVVANFLHRLIVITQVMWEVTQNSVSVRAGHGK